MAFDREKQAIQRERIQARAEELSLQHQHLLITWATGSGKGRAVMRCINASPSPKKWYVVCPEIIQVENFKQDLRKHGFEHLLGTKIEDVICYASMEKLQGGPFNLALNEVHRLSELKYNIGKSIDFDQIVSDSATVPYDVKLRLEDICPYHEINLPLKKAVEIGLLPPAEYYLVKVALNADQKKEIGVQVRSYNYWRTKYYGTKNPFFATKMNQARGNSKKLMASYKTDEAQRIIERISPKRFVCFTGSVEQSMQLNPDNSVNSYKTKKNNLKIIEKFNNFEIDSIFLNRMGREGQNLEATEVVIIIQLDSGNDDGLSFLQTTGRGLRGEAPQIYIIYTDAEQDMQYLNRALRNVDKSSIVNL